MLCAVQTLSHSLATSPRPRIRKALKAAALLHLAEHRFDGCFAPRVDPLAAFREQLSVHSLLRRQVGRRPAARRGRRIFVFATRGCDKRRGPDGLDLASTFLGGVAGISNDPLGNLACLVNDLLHHLGEMELVAAVREDVVRNDDLALGVDGGLGVVSLDESVARLEGSCCPGP